MAFVNPPDEQFRFGDTLKAMSRLVLDMFEKAHTGLKNGDISIYEMMENDYDELRGMYDMISEQILDAVSKELLERNLVRLIVSTMRLATYLERIGNHAFKITMGSVNLYGDKSVTTIDTVTEMGKSSIIMLRGIVDAMESSDTSGLYGYGDLLYDIVSRSDDILRESVDFIRMNPDMTNSRIYYISVARFVERIGDDMCRMAEEMIYATTTKRIRLDQ